MERRKEVKMEVSTLSKPPLISRKREEALSPGHWRVLTVSTKERQASKEDKAGREPHWLRWISPRVLASSARRYATTHSRILEMV